MVYNNGMKKLIEFKKTEQYVPQTKEEKNLTRAFSMLQNGEEAAAFLRDLMTVAEIEEFANRFEIAHLLTEGLSYQSIAKKMGTSTTTVTRVSHWLKRGCGGYREVLKRM